MSIKVSDLIEQVAELLVDKGNVRWSQSELINYINDALAAIIMRRPSITAADSVISVTNNPVVLPNDAYSLLTVEKIGDYRGQYTPIETLDRFYPMWRTQIGIAQCWTKHNDELLRFWIFPAPQEPINVEVIYSKVITVKAQTDVIPLTSVYVGILIDFVLFRAFGKDAENASEESKSLMHFQLFAVAMGDKSATDKAKYTARKQSTLE
ncbi:hypothetical protein C0W59_19175 [Photobacterium kishitanii]|uniref:phage adaptor protein n=1 Tax=Photobacterium kishitanii TaxID=318456 RepID=UPI000D16A0E8|nr:DUF6682 family protein [Photobacterium kishitanii]PSV11657.1 hypothetical protein C0W59_19175 [Photobacterium kishitanii]